MDKSVLILLARFGRAMMDMLLFARRNVFQYNHRQNTRPEVKSVGVP